MSRPRARTIALVAAVRHRAEVRRRRAHPQLLFAVLVGAVVGTVAVVGWLPVPVYGRLWPEPGAYAYGTVVGSEPDVVLALAREFAATAVVAVAALAVFGALASTGWDDPPTEVVTAVPLRTAIDGVLADDLLEAGWFVGPLSVGGALAFTAGTGASVTILGALAGVAAVLVTGLLVGSATGLAVRASARRSPRLYAARLPVGFVFLSVTFVTLAAGRTAGSWLATTPLSWYGDLLLVTTPGVASDPTRALAALALAGVVGLASLAAVRRAARSLWFAEAPLEEGTVDAAGRSAADAALERLLDRPTAAATRATWRRIRRSPRAMLYVVLPVAFVGPVALEVSVRSRALVPILVTVYVAAAVGLGTTLNLPGNERVALSTVRTIPGGRRSVARGHAVAALLPGVPIVVGVATAAGVAVGYAPTQLLALALVAVVLAIAGVGLSLGVGTFLPKRRRVVDSSLVPPELSAMAVFCLVLAVLAAPAFVGLTSSALGESSRSPLVAVSLTTLLAGTAGGLGYRYAVGALDRPEGDRPASS